MKSLFKLAVCGFLSSSAQNTQQKSEAFSYLSQMVSNHQLEFGGEWQLKYVIPQVIQSRKLALKRIKKTERERMRRLERQPRVRREANRVIGGFDVVDNSWQFMVDIGGLCGGSLISNRLVLTAAHCCQKASFDYMTMRIGIRSLNDETNSVNRRAERKVIHPDFQAERLTNDICLVLLNEPVDFDERIQAIALPGREEAIFESETHGFVAGWGLVGQVGSTSYSELLPTQLKNAMVPLVIDSDCSNSYSGIVDTTTSFCAGDDQTDTCTFDSGGPLVVLKQRNSKYRDHVAILAGITSWGEGCAVDQKPGVYTRVQNYLDWIEETRQTLDDNEVSCGNIAQFVNPNSPVPVEWKCSSMDEQCWLHCPAGYVPSLISVRCRGQRTWMSAIGQNIPKKSLTCEPQKNVQSTDCGTLDGYAETGRDHLFDRTKIDARCNNHGECLFYCKGTDVRASGMFYTRCKSRTRSWKPRPRIVQEPTC